MAPRTSPKTCSTKTSGEYALTDYALFKALCFLYVVPILCLQIVPILLIHIGSINIMLMIIPLYSKSHMYCIATLLMLRHMIVAV